MGPGLKTGHTLFFPLPLAGSPCDRFDCNKTLENDRGNILKESVSLNDCAEHSDSTKLNTHLIIIVTQKKNKHLCCLGHRCFRGAFQ